MKNHIKKSLLTILLIFPLLLSNIHLTYAGDISFDQQQHYMNTIKNLQEELDKKNQELQDKDNSTLIPNIKLTSTPTFTVAGGQKTTLTLDIKNISSYAAQNLFVQATLADASAMPFTLKFIDATNTISSLTGGTTKKVKLELDVDALAESKTYAINLDYTYSNTEKKGFTGKDVIYVKVDNTTTFPKVSLSEFKLSDNNVIADSSVNLSAVLQNIGTQTAYDVQILVDGLSTDTLTITNSTNSLYFSTLDKDAKNNINFTIATAPKIKQGNYPLTFKITYKDNNGKEYTNEQKYFINVTGTLEDTKKSFLQIQNLTVPENTFVVGKTFILHLDIVNTGDIEAKNVKVTAEYGTDGAVVPKSPSIQLVNSLTATETKGFDFTFAATSTAKTQNYPISFKLEYEDGSTDTDGVSKIISYTQYTGVNISNPEADKKEDEDDDDKVKSIPKIIISKYSCNPIIVNAGDEFDLNMTFKNTHPTKTVSNIKIFLSVPEKSETGNIFIPVESSNTFFVDKITPNQTVDRSVRLFAMPDAAPKTYDLIVNFDYEDETGSLPAASEFIGISVKQPSKLEVGEFVTPPQVSVGEPVVISFDFYNTGKVTLNNLMIKIAGDFDIQNANSYYGNFESGNSEYYEGTIIPSVMGKQSGKLIISYDEPSGARIETEKDIELNVMEAMVTDAFSPEGGKLPGDMDINMGMEKPKKGILDYIKSPIVWGIVAAVVIVIVGIVVFMKRRKKQKGMDLDD